ncbi:MAG: Lrp/AsnC ligand binding domain-containing protein [Hadesarchaea archaeon]|nr:Lrp/AsnC ligand binding domain-containing protein [Hadesarchaea archaeon]
MQAILYVRTNPGMTLELLKVVRKMEGVKFAAAITGRFDIIARVEAKNIEELGRKIVDEIHNLNGVSYTETAPIVG